MSLEPDEAKLTRREGDQARVEQGRPLAIGAEELEEGDAAAIGGAVGEVEIACGGVTLTVWCPEGPLTTQSDSHSYPVKTYSIRASMACTLSRTAQAGDQRWPFGRVDWGAAAWTRLVT